MKFTALLVPTIVARNCLLASVTCVGTKNAPRAPTKLPRLPTAVPSYVNASAVETLSAIANRAAATPVSAAESLPDAPAPLLTAT